MTQLNLKRSKGGLVAVFCQRKGLAAENQQRPGVLNYSLGGVNVRQVQC